MKNRIKFLDEFVSSENKINNLTKIETDDKDGIDSCMRLKIGESGI